MAGRGRVRGVRPDLPTRPVFPCYKNLAKLKGQQNAFVDMAELCIKHVVYRANESPEPNAFLAEIKKAVGGIGSNLYETELSQIRTIASKWYLIQLHAVVDTFFGDMCREFQLLKKTNRTWDPAEGASKLERLVKNLAAVNRRAVTMRVEFSLVEYYRHVRNYFLHEDAKALSGLRRRHRTLLKHPTLGSFVRGRPAPNLPDEVSYHDFVVAARALHHLAPIVSDACDLKCDEVATAMVQDKRLLQLLRRRRARPDFLEYVQTLARVEFWVHDSETQKRVATVVNKLMEKVPTRRESKRSR